jgi:hypothetical protein
LMAGLPIDPAIEKNSMTRALAIHLKSSEPD